MATIFICMHCGERRELKKEDASKIKKYCPRCETEEGRKKIDDENEEIRKKLHDRPNSDTN